MKNGESGRPAHWVPQDGSSKYWKSSNYRQFPVYEMLRKWDQGAYQKRKKIITSNNFSLKNPFIQRNILLLKQNFRIMTYNCFKIQIVMNT